jgi:hypothetical protein
MKNKLSSSFGESQAKVLRVSIRDKLIDYPITLALQNFFDEIRNGIIQKNFLHILYRL